VRLKRNKSIPLSWAGKDSIQVGVDTANSFQICNLPLNIQAVIDQADGVKQFPEISESVVDSLLKSEVLINLDALAHQKIKIKNLKLEIQNNQDVSNLLLKIFKDLGFAKAVTRKSDPITSSAQLLIIFGFIPKTLKIPHLLLNIVGETIAIGPLVVPGETSCLNCLYLHRKDLNPAWPKLAMRFDQTKLIVEGRLGYQAAAICASAVQNFLDEANEFDLRDKSLEVNLSKNFMQLRELSPHPGCGCKW
jgi:hypothetical protein